jgi:uncharacterized membrane protein YjgN (DUF898 family)
MKHWDADAESAFGFDGTWREYAPIAFTNLLLSIVTLGIYRFWATTRARQYLWSRTRFVDERLEWAGTGLELFIGFLLVLLLFGLPYFVLSFVAQALLLRGQNVLAAALTIGSFLMIFYLYGLARYRALRYRLSRTHWRGIRGGSDDPGFGYGLTYMWKTVVGWLPLGLAVPWTMTSLWNDRWNKLSFGPFSFEAEASPSGLMARYMLFYLSPIVFFGVFAVIGVAGFGVAGIDAGQKPSDGLAVGIAVTILLGVLVFYVGLGLIALAYYAKFFREAVGSLRWRNLEFAFDASTRDWLVLFLGDIALVVCTLGIGMIFLSYRHWKFFAVHMQATGEIRLDELTQSQTKMAVQGEGLLDAFDIGAI